MEETKTAFIRCKILISFLALSLKSESKRCLWKGCWGWPGQWWWASRVAFLSMFTSDSWYSLVFIKLHALQLMRILIEQLMKKLSMCIGSYWNTGYCYLQNQPEFPAVQEADVWTRREIVNSKASKNQCYLLWCLKLFLFLVKYTVPAYIKNEKFVAICWFNVANFRPSSLHNIGTLNLLLPLEWK